MTPTPSASSNNAEFTFNGTVNTGSFNTYVGGQQQQQPQQQEQPQQQQPQQPQQEQQTQQPQQPQHESSQQKRQQPQQQQEQQQQHEEAEASEQRTKRQKVGTTHDRQMQTFINDNMDDLEREWIKLRQEPNFMEGVHKYKLEHHGILQCGQFLAMVPDVPEEIYDIITLAPPPPPLLPLDVFGQYIYDIMQSPVYGTDDCTQLIYNTSSLSPDHPKDIFVFVSRVLQLFSDSIHHRLKPCHLSESEAAYCHFGIWPLLNQVVRRIQDVDCHFRVGETKLMAMNDKPTYLADGTVYIQSSGLEILLLEVSGHYGNIDITRNAYDHIKGAFGMYSMIKAILRQYPNADPSLLNQVTVLFLHASSRDKSIRLWQMKPTTTGELLLLERLCKGSISTDHTDVGAMVDLMQFFWAVKVSEDDLFQIRSDLTLSNSSTLSRQWLVSRR
ncbi:unnamed protein product [Absidia cylindrospora]